jgi:hypothetical protein
LKRTLLAGVAMLALTLGACSTAPTKIDAVNTKIDAVKTNALNTLQTVVADLVATDNTDLTNGDAIALAATPPDTDFDNCAKAGIAVATAAKKVIAASNSANAGLISLGEFTSLYVPGSDQYNWAESTLVSGCSAKIAKEMSIVPTAGQTLTAIPVLLKLATPLAGAAASVLPVAAL